MIYIEQIENALTYIEDNLKVSMNLADIAQAAGYSEFHFLRVFKEITYLTPVDYIRRRRLSEIAREIMQSNRPISDIAFEYGFNSKENFTRAFKAEHHVLPTEYKAAGNSLKLYNRLRLQSMPFELTPDILTMPGFALTVYISDEDYAPNFWNKYNCRKLSTLLSSGKITADYGVSLWNSEIDHLDYWCGIRTDEALGDISGTVQLYIPGGLYAVFATPATPQADFVNTIHRSWAYILNVWLPKSDYQYMGGYQFETYVEASRTFSEQIYIPVQVK